ncbi:MAG TPA: type IVB secretion system protein IcmV [Gammaproteobacteria bacterium]|nr:type IVB secretion system protein IcmV [Gammaproteobacteria bacterium]
MAIRQVFKISRKTFFNPRAWFGYDVLKENSKTIVDLMIDLFTLPTVVREETFEEAVQRLQLSEADLKLTARNYYLYALFFVVLGTIVLFYSFYLVVSHRLFLAWLLGFSIAALFYANAFRYHFWFFQIKHCKLGCTFAEWRSGKPLRE